MKYIIIIGIIALIIWLLIMLVLYVCFRKCFFASKKGTEGFSLPEGELYQKYRERMEGWYQWVKTLPCTELEITTFDGKKQYARYFEHKKGAVTEIMLHGYRGSAERDLSGGVERAFRLGHNVILVELRTSGRSEGNVISFGINESRDCIKWIEKASEFLGKDAKFILTGISMGASTVLMTAGKGVPPCVVGVLADCPFSSQEQIIKKTIGEMKLPAFMYRFVSAGAKVFGRFDLNELSPIEAVKTINVPVIFFHGEDDDFVPCEMSRLLFEKCNAPKQLVTVKNAGHGLAFPVDEEGYLKAASDFFTEHGIYKNSQN